MHPFYKMQIRLTQNMLVRHVVLAFFLCVLTINMHAENYMHVSVKGGVNNNPTHDTLSIGGMGSMELGYRWQHMSGWMMDIGLGLGYGIINDLLPDSIRSEQGMDYQGDTYIKHEYLSEMRDELKALTFALPIKFGYGYQRFYAMAGVQLKGQLPLSLQTKGILTETLEYENLIDQLPQKSQTPYSAPHDKSFTFDVQVCAEIGMRLNYGYKYSNRSTGIRNTYLAAFVDYSVYTTRPTIPLTVGVKLTWLLQINPDNCRCLR